MVPRDSAWPSESFRSRKTASASRAHNRESVESSRESVKVLHLSRDAHDLRSSPRFTHVAFATQTTFFLTCRTISTTICSRCAPPCRPSSRSSSRQRCRWDSQDCGGCYAWRSQCGTWHRASQCRSLRKRVTFATQTTFFMTCRTISTTICSKCAPPCRPQRCGRKDHVPSVQQPRHESRIQRREEHQQRTADLPDRAAPLPTVKWVSGQT